MARVRVRRDLKYLGDATIAARCSCDTPTAIMSRAGFKVCDMSSMKSHTCTVWPKPIRFCALLNSVGLAQGRTLAPLEERVEDPEV
jgi:hypothetical protein